MWKFLRVKNGEPCCRRDALRMHSIGTRVVCHGRIFFGSFLSQMMSLFLAVFFSMQIYTMLFDIVSFNGLFGVKIIEQLVLSKPCHCLKLGDVFFSAITPWTKNFEKKCRPRVESLSLKCQVLVDVRHLGFLFWPHS